MDISMTLVHSFYWYNIYTLCQLSKQDLTTPAGFVMFIQAILYLNQSSIGSMISKSTRFENQAKHVQVHWSQIAASAALNAFLFRSMFMDDTCTKMLATYGHYAPIIPKLYVLASLSQNMITDYLTSSWKARQNYVHSNDNNDD